MSGAPALARHNVKNTPATVRDPLSRGEVLGARGPPAVMIRRAGIVIEAVITEGESSHPYLVDTE